MRKINRREQEAAGGEESAPRRCGRDDRRQTRLGLLEALPDPFQLRGDVLGALPSVVGVLFETLLHDTFERTRRGRNDSRNRRRLLIQQRRDEAGLAVRRKRALAGRHLVEDGAEREQLGARIHLVRLHLLRGHVWHRAHHHTGVGERSRRRRVVDERRRRLVQLGETEVQDLHAGLGEHDVRRLQIPVDDADTMRGGERLGQLGRDSQCLVEWKGPAARVLPGRASAPVAADDEEIARGVGVTPPDPTGEGERPPPLVSRAASVSPSRSSMTRNSIGRPAPSC